MMAQLPIWLSNFLMGIRIRFTKEPYLSNNDGRLVPLDDWEGYEICLRPGCGHYRCEHSFSDEWTAVYIAPGAKRHRWEESECVFCGVERIELNKDEECPNVAKEGDKTSWPVGCMNAGCKCQGFWTASDLIGYIQRITHARLSAAYKLGEVPGVAHVESGVSVTVWVDTYTESRDESAWDAIYEAERSLYDEYAPKTPENCQGVLFDFNTRWSKPPED